MNDTSLKLLKQKLYDLNESKMYCIRLDYDFRIGVRNKLIVFLPFSKNNLHTFSFL